MSSVERQLLAERLMRELRPGGRPLPGSPEEAAERASERIQACVERAREARRGSE